LKGEIQNRAAGGPPAEPPKPNRMLTLVASMDALARRLLALEQREIPVAEKGEAGRGLAAARVNDDGELVFTLTDGELLNAGRVRGKDGVSPEPPPAPAAGVGVSAAVVNDDGHLVVALTDGRSIDAGRVRGKDGVSPEPPPAPADGVGIANAVQNEQGELLIALTDGRTLNVGRIRAKDGEPGRNADPAEPGATIETATIDDAGQLVLVMTDGRTLHAGRAVGKPGEPGDSIKGEAGRGISKIEIVNNELIVHLTDRTKQNLGRVVGKDGEATSPSPPAPAIELGDCYRANISAKDLDRLMMREVVIDGNVYQFVTLG